MFAVRSFSTGHLTMLYLRLMFGRVMVTAKKNVFVTTVLLIPLSSWYAYYLAELVLPQELKPDNLRHTSLHLFIYVARTLQIAAAEHLQYYN